LNRPEKRNALSGELLTELAERVDQAADNDQTSVIVLRGAGKGFSAGFDLGGAPSRNAWADRERLRRNGRKLDAVWDCPIPVIASVHGFALAGGADLALHCDFLLIADDARIGYPPVRNLGVPPSHMWLYRVGPQMAKRLLFTGDSLDGNQAVACGLALESHPSTSLDEAALSLAQRIALVSRECLIGNKAVVNQGIDLMGRHSLSRLSRLEDVFVHDAPSARQFREEVNEHGVSYAVRQRDSVFDVDISRATEDLEQSGPNL
jgi:enoyl-CoA hydratase